MYSSRKQSAGWNRAGRSNEQRVIGSPRLLGTRKDRLNQKRSCGSVRAKRRCHGAENYDFFITGLNVIHADKPVSIYREKRSLSISTNQLAVGDPGPEFGTIPSGEYIL